MNETPENVSKTFQYFFEDLNLKQIHEAINDVNI